MITDDQGDNRAPDTDTTFEFLRTETRKLPVPVPDHELLAAGHELGQLLVDKAAIEEQARGVAATYRERVKELDKRITQLQGTVATGTRHENVDCNVFGSWDSNAIRVVRSDTDEVIDERALEPDERRELEQTSIPTRPSDEDLAGTGSPGDDDNEGDDDPEYTDDVGPGEGGPTVGDGTDFGDGDGDGDSLPPEVDDDAAIAATLTGETLTGGLTNSEWALVNAGRKADATDAVATRLGVFKVAARKLIKDATG